MFDEFKKILKQHLRKLNVSLLEMNTASSTSNTGSIKPKR